VSQAVLYEAATMFSQLLLAKDLLRGLTPIAAKVRFARWLCFGKRGSKVEAEVVEEGNAEARELQGGGIRRLATIIKEGRPRNEVVEDAREVFCGEILHCACADLSDLSVLSVLLGTSSYTRSLAQTPPSLRPTRSSPSERTAS
jgi:hypothetical protein